ncbi:hypothetical protein [Streptomyces sp. UNOB3_S3]|uniref:hypothetical protein n=1 Tax=Streptomyces sp. UNOB3_S3 TaxID=2871682 RepID=UPI001E53B6E2|nr:hypothetical protein [Streptomyces sp. UNOB3_S3]MCC3775143.1 hypothetical protein [Streptomyces sp. UNOB3_S3]
MTPQSLKLDLADVGLHCEETHNDILQQDIVDVRSALQPSSLQAFLIAGSTEIVSARAAKLRTGARQVLTARLTSGAHELVDVLADADQKIQNLLLILGSAKAGTHGFVKELIAGDRAGQELFSAVNAPHKSARPFVEQLVARSGRGGRLTKWVSGYGSPALSLLARLAELDQEPLATSTWTPDPTGGITGPYMTMLGNVIYGEHFDQLRKRYEAVSQPFPGIEAPYDPGTKRMKTGDAIVKFFKDTCQGVITTVAQQVDKGDLEALITTYIEPVMSQDDYVLPGDRFIYLAQDYDAQQQLAFGVGIVSLHYELTVKDYKRKSKHGGDTHDVTLPMHARGIQYPGAVGFSNACLDNRYVTGKCESCCRDAKDWYRDNPQYGTWPADNKDCPPVS